MCEGPDFEQGAPPDYCDTPESRAVWRRVEAFAVSQSVAEMLADLTETLARMAEIIDAENASSLSWTRVELETWLKRVRSMSASTSRAEFNLLDAEALSFFLGDPTVRAAYDTASSMESLEIVVSQLAALQAQDEQSPLSADEFCHKQALEDLRATLDEEVRDGLRRLRSHD